MINPKITARGMFRCGSRTSPAMAAAFDHPLYGHMTATIATANAFRSNAAQSAGQTGYVPPGRLAEAKTKYVGRISDKPFNGIYYWGFNMKDPVVGGPANLKLRQAIAYSIDKDAMIKTTYNGSRDKATGWAPKDTPGYKPNLDQYTYDVSKAKSTLAEWEKGTGKKAADLPPIKLAMQPDGLQVVSGKEAPSSQWRRSIYLTARRNYPLSFLNVFDFPAIDTNCTRRVPSATPLQSLQP